MNGQPQVVAGWRHDPAAGSLLHALTSSAADPAPQIDSAVAQQQIVAAADQSSRRNQSG